MLAIVLTIIIIAVSAPCDCGHILDTFIKTQMSQ